MPQEIPVPQRIEQAFAALDEARKRPDRNGRSTMRPVNSIISIAVALACSAPITTYAANEAYSRSDAERYIKASEAAWAASVATNDVSVVQRILADDVVWVLDGRVIGKAHAVAEAAHAAVWGCSRSRGSTGRGDSKRRAPWR